MEHMISGGLNLIQPELNNKYFSQSAGVQLNLLSKKGWFIQNDLNHQRYSGLTDGFNQNYWLWNAGIGKKFLKKQQAELKLTVFDLLNENKAITRNIGDNYFEDNRTNVIRRYFLLSLTYNINRMAGRNQQMPQNMQRMMERGMRQFRN